jgi:hypothetical protein
MKKPPTKRMSVHDGRFERVEQNIDRCMDLFAAENGFSSRQDAWAYLCTWRAAEYWHPFEVIAWYAVKWSMSAELIQIVLGNRSEPNR